MMNYRCGDIVLTRVIFSEGDNVKKRPALVVSSNDYHENRQEIIITAITSNIYRVLTGDTTLNYWEEAGLRFPSIVTGIFQTIKKNMVEKKLGTLSPHDFQRVRKNLEHALGIFQ